ncbi:DsbA family protein [Rhodococcus sp. IEGM 1330]|uniref:DsbA family protein n=1 Tax=Rhodococcus sp. IEGM 1330 TaxID=3082225 RepID=UPI002953F899|nr:DsbA family protein [Rhodococcus sp. IEGM 1330]MDV8023581.1 DsbA family protein [Rhodococcus sp. IEGM 1330]
MKCTVHRSLRRGQERQLTTTITNWADIRCPWCWIGHRQLVRALGRLEAGTRVEYRSFLLEPAGPTRSGMTVREAALSSWGFDEARWAAHSRKIVAGGTSESLIINIDTALVVDSRNAHRLLKLVADRQLNTFEAWDALYSRHFEFNDNIADWIVLRSVGEQVGLAGGDITTLVETDEYSAAVDDDIRDAAALGISSIPTVLADSVRTAGDPSTGVDRIVDIPAVGR